VIQRLEHPRLADGDVIFFPFANRLFSFNGSKMGGGKRSSGRRAVSNVQSPLSLPPLVFFPNPSHVKCPISVQKMLPGQRALFFSH
jgi:hypothetical protein